MKFALASAAALAAIAIAAPASAQTCAQTYAIGTASVPGSYGNMFTVGTGATTLCYTFTLNQALTLSSAGFTVAASAPFNFSTTAGSIGLQSTTNGGTTYSAYTPTPPTTMSPNYDSIGPMNLTAGSYRVFVSGSSPSGATGNSIVSSSFQFNAAAVPEAGTWAMMIAGFGLVGGAMRRRATKVSFA